MEFRQSTEKKAPAVSTQAEQKKLSLQRIEESGEG